MLSFSGVSFYVLFNDNLLNEKKLAALVEELRQQIQRKKDAIAIRDTEYKEYFERQEIIRNQSVSRELYEENEEAIGELARKAEELSKKIGDTSQELAEARGRKK